MILRLTAIIEVKDDLTGIPADMKKPSSKNMLAKHRTRPFPAKKHPLNTGINTTKPGLEEEAPDLLQQYLMENGGPISERRAINLLI